LIIVIGSYDSCGDTPGQHGIGNIANDAGSSAYNRVLANSLSWDNSCASAYQGEPPNSHAAGYRASGCDMHAFPNPTLVIN
jgi:hypothetical protein